MTAAKSVQLRREDERLLTGKARFVDNIHLDRMVHGVFVRSPVAHAMIGSIDASKALEAGALCVLTARDLPFNDRPWVVRYWHHSIRGGMPTFLPVDRVRYVGEPVAFVVAANRYVAEDLAALVEVDYQPLPPIATPEDAMKEGVVRLHPDWENNVAATYSQANGDAKSAMKEAGHRIRRRFSFGRQTPITMETRGIVADFDATRGTLTAWMSTQAHYNVRQNLSTLLDVPEYQVRVIAEDVGGGFGAKSRTYPEEIVASHASRLLGRPVKWIEDRFENLQATTHSRAIDVDLELGCDGEGHLTALKAVLTLDVGAYVFTSGVTTSEVACAHMCNGYRIPNFEVVVRCVGTNKTPIATYRGAGQPEACFPTECLMDALANELGLSPVELRRRNLVRPRDMPYEPGSLMVGTRVHFESGDFPAMLDLVVAESGYTEEREVTAEGEHCAWGLACGIEGGGVVNFETALVRVDLSGNVTIFSGMTTQGQGQVTAYAQVCAETLGVEFDRITVFMGDTQLMAFGRGAFASRGAIFGGNSVLGASQELRRKILEYAAILLQEKPADLTIRNGRIWTVAGRETDIDLARIAQSVLPGGPLHAGEQALEAQFLYKADRPVTYGMSAHAAKVKLDPRTGFFEIVDYMVGHDAGRAINHMIVEGQIVGGAADGIGGALFSELIYDEEGQLLTGSLADYLVATAPELPRIRLAEMETVPGTNPLGVRGIGEGGLIPAAPAIANALARAMGSPDVNFEGSLYKVPLKQERVFQACRLAERQKARG